MRWYTAGIRVAILSVIAAGIGWYYGRPLVAVLLALLALVAYWLLQLRRVQLWLQDPLQPPPDIHGIWGDILSQFYRQQRRERETQARLQSTLDYFRDCFSSMREGVVIVDGRGVIGWSNAAATRLTGLRYPEDVGQHISNLVREPALQDYLDAGDYDAPLQYPVTGDDRRYLEVQVNRFGKGDRLLFFRDVSAVLRMEQIRRDFVANVSHELRTPLTVITGYLDTFLSDTASLPSRLIKPMQQMTQQAVRMENLLKDLLWLSRIESEERQEKREWVDIRALLRELQDELVTSYPQREVKFLLETDHRVTGNYLELHSAVSNLVVNAIKYSPDDSVVTVSWREVEGEYHLVVEDAGVGVDPVHLPRLTERFYRVDDSRTGSTGGTGLGLAIVKHVAVSHGARLRIDSTPGRGSRFTLAFPARIPP
ncbi:MAG: phosphate regulon sensor histidine kinase PhoR [Halioglobus sp.]